MPRRRPALPILASVLALGAAPALAQAPAAPNPPAAATADANPVLARVDGQEIRASDVLDSAADLLPEEIRSAPPAAVIAMLPPDMMRQLTDRAVTERAFLIAARKVGLDKDPEVARRIRRAEEQELQQALLTRELAALVTDAAVRQRFDRDNAGRRGEEEVHARHILVRTETEARQVIADLARPGADFAAIAKQRSIDPGAQNGGDLGFFKKGDMVPEFANAAFALQAGQTSTTPVRTQFGWHVIRVEARRTAPPADFDEVKDTLRRQLMEEQVGVVVNRVRSQANIERLDQAPPARSLMDNAAPPPPASGAPATPPARR